ncbi:MAG TPA: GNAT family N-acetyltransferase [Ferrovaceae bacterium]|jgi:GNAT superfamily N-acetyltransferase|nr:GNAT family N-acetyltransferase [Ferrovaceae bacterium]
MNYIISHIPKGYLHTVLYRFLGALDALQIVNKDALLEKLFTEKSSLWAVTLDPTFATINAYFTTVIKEYPEGKKLFVDFITADLYNKELLDQIQQLLSNYIEDAGCVSFEFGQPPALENSYEKEERNGITYEVTSFTNLMSHAQHLFPKHFEEVAADKDKIKLNVHLEGYYWFEQHHQLHVIVCKKGSELIGYFIGIVRPHLHYKNSLTAYTDIFYINPEYRKGRAGINLFKYAEKTLWHRGVQRIYMGTKLKLDIGPILDRLGYNPIERIYTKVKS